MAKFTSEEDERMIDLVKGKLFLYSVTEKEYKNSNLRKLAWAEIGEAIGKSGK